MMIDSSAVAGLVADHCTCRDYIFSITIIIRIFTLRLQAPNCRVGCVGNGIELVECGDLDDGNLVAMLMTMMIHYYLSVQNWNC